MILKGAKVEKLDGMLDRAGKVRNGKPQTLNSLLCQTGQVHTGHVRNKLQTLDQNKTMGDKTLGLVHLCTHTRTNPQTYTESNM